MQSTLEHPSAPITGSCPRCENHASLEQLDSVSEPMCNACNEDQAKCDAALFDLQAVLEPVFKTWAKRWNGEGVDTEFLTGVAGDLGAFSPGPVEWVRSTTDS